GWRPAPRRGARDRAARPRPGADAWFWSWRSLCQCAFAVAAVEPAGRRAGKGLALLIGYFVSSQRQPPADWSAAERTDALEQTVRPPAVLVHPQDARQPQAAVRAAHGAGPAVVLESRSRVVPDAVFQDAQRR